MITHLSTILLAYTPLRKAGSRARGAAELGGIRVRGARVHGGGGMKRACAGGRALLRLGQLLLALLCLALLRLALLLLSLLRTARGGESGRGGRLGSGGGRLMQQARRRRGRWHVRCWLAAARTVVGLAAAHLMLLALLLALLELVALLLALLRTRHGVSSVQMQRALCGCGRLCALLYSTRAIVGVPA